MLRPFALPALLLLALAGPIAGCGEGSADTSAVEAMARAANASADYGARYTMDGSIRVEGQQIPISGRASVEPGGKQGIVRMSFLGNEVETFIDDHYVVMSTDILPSTSGLPAGTRYLRIDVDEVGQSVGINTGPLRKLQSLDPGSAARMAAAASNVHSVGGATENGVEVTRYEWSATLGEIAEALADGTDIAAKMPEEIRDAKLDATMSIDRRDRVRSFTIRMDASAMKMSLTTTVTSFSQDIAVDVPTGDEVYDVTDAIAGGLDELGG